MESKREARNAYTQRTNSQSLTGGYSWLWHRVVVLARPHMQPGGPIRQPYAMVDYITQAGTKNLASDLWLCQLTGRVGLEPNKTGGLLVRANLLVAATCLRLINVHKSYSIYNFWKGTEAYVHLMSALFFYCVTL